MIFIRLILIVFVSSVITTLNAQNNSEKQKQLELQREKLQAEIKQINSLLFQNTAKEKNLISQTEDLSLKISVRMKLIATNNQQANILHWTLGGPWFKDQANDDKNYAKEWFRARDETIQLWD